MKKWILLFLKGVAMGASDVVPGVSGGTIAFISGIYERLIHAIKSINLTNIKLFFTGHFREFWKNIDGNFLVCLAAGIAVSFLSLAKLITYLLETHPIFVWSFFCGLIVASVVFIGKTVKWDWKTAITLVIFAILSFFITSPGNAPLGQNGAYWYIFLCGAIAICAMILPGISGSFILVLLGQYNYILAALGNFRIDIIAIFMIGALIGIVSFSHVLNWLFKNFEMIIKAALTGFMLGSINKIWPWKNTIASIDCGGKEPQLIQENILPTQLDGQFWGAIALMIAGFAIIFIIEFISEKMKTSGAEAEA